MMRDDHATAGPASPLRVGMVGVGAISAAYRATIDRLRAVDLVAVADLDAERAGRIAAEHGVPALPVPELINDPNVDLVLNLTNPAAHAPIALQALEAGKQVYTEKPLATTRQDGAAVVDAGRRAGLRVGSAPDTVLGTGTQTARKAIDDGVIGTPVAATATMVTPGHERWHPHPDFYYRAGGGPLLDMGPYYVTALLTLLGSVTRVIGAASHLHPFRTIGSGPRSGEQIPVEVDTHVTGILVHESGVLSTLVMSFDAAATKAAHIEVHGDRGSLIAPDPNNFDGDVRWHPVGGEWSEIPVSAGYRDASRGFGLADLAAADSAVRANATVGYHVLDIMLAVLESADRQHGVDLSSSCERPDPVPLGIAPGGRLEGDLADR